jgi:hypothetical protein
MEEKINGGDLISYFDRIDDLEKQLDENKKKNSQFERDGILTNSAISKMSEQIVRRKKEIDELGLYLLNNREKKRRRRRLRKENQSGGDKKLFSIPYTPSQSPKSFLLPSSSVSTSNSSNSQKFPNENSSKFESTVNDSGKFFSNAKTSNKRENENLEDDSSTFKILNILNKPLKEEENIHYTTNSENNEGVVVENIYSKDGVDDDDEEEDILYILETIQPYIEKTINDNNNIIKNDLQGFHNINLV